VPDGSGARRVLVAEDDGSQRAMIVEYLREEGFAVDATSNGAAALESARTTPPDLLLLDVNMPTMDGPSLLSVWTEDATLSTVPVVLVSGTDGLPQIAQQYGVRATLAKPFDLDVLRAVVDQVLAHPAAPPDTGVIEPDGLR
jgi:DNA-binding response OmpR family regulator